MPRRAGCLLGDADFGDWSRMTARAVTHSPSPNTRRALIFASLFAGGDSKRHNRSGSVTVELQLTYTPKPHPVLPGGVLCDQQRRHDERGGLEIGADRSHRAKLVDGFGGKHDTIILISIIVERAALAVIDDPLCAKAAGASP
jgi:hypothetical protein